MKLHLPAIVCIVGAIVFSSTSLAGVSGLRVDDDAQPMGIDSRTPRLSWTLTNIDPAARGVHQLAYRVLVASSAAKLAKDDGDLWNSGRIASAEDMQVAYSGKALLSGQQAFWKVAAWTSDIAAPDWSEPAEWTMGVLDPQDWQPARWIGASLKTTGESPPIGFHARPTPDQAESKWVQVDLGRSVPIDSVRLFPMNHAGVQGFAFPARFKIEAAETAGFERPVWVADHTADDYPNPGAKPVEEKVAVSARYVRVTATHLVHRDNGYCFALRQLAIFAGSRNIAIGAAVEAKDSVEQYGWGKSALTDGSSGDPPARFASMLLRRSFSARGGVRRATIFVSGMGQYELSINGAKVGEQLLAPGWTNYRKTVLYDTFDVTHQIRAGENAVGLFLGNGMYNIRPSPGRYVKFTNSFGPLKAIALLQLEYEDGTTEKVATDAKWEVASGPITYSNIFGGEDYDARLEPNGWNTPGFTADALWAPATEVDGPGGVLRGHSAAAPPIQAIEVHRPVAVKSPRAGVVVYDLGQNASHIPRLVVRGAAGSSVRVIPSELLGKDGYVDRASCVQDAGGPAWWQYTLKGTGSETYFPKFFYQGCRYFQVESFAAESGGDLPTVESVDGVVVHSSAEPTGTFECSNELFNRIYQLVRWAQRSNMVSLMTDCPHREKLGWLEELHLNGPSLRYNFGLARLFSKEMNDMADAQLDNGFLPNIAPEYFIASTNKLTDAFRNSPEWGSSYIIVPWQQYLFNDDVDLLRNYYPRMVRYLDFLAGTATDDVISVGLGDWYDIGPKPPWGSQLTPPPFTATAIYYYDTCILGDIAERLGNTGDATAYRSRADRIRAAFNKRFFDPQHKRYGTGSQCCCAMPLVLGLADADVRDIVLESLIADIRARGNALSAGDVGYRFVLRALADAGRSDVIFDMNNQSERPGYGMQLSRGATSLTEKWDASVGKFGSQNHFMLGQINEWFFHDLAGIQPDPKAPGFKKIIIRPAVVGDITHVRANYDSPRGKITSEWTRQGDELHLHVIIPLNATAKIYVPAAAPNSVTEGNIAAASAPGVKFVESSGTDAVFEVGSGEYVFNFRLR